MILTGEAEVFSLQPTSATLSTINLRMTEAVSNLGLRGDRPAISRLSNGTVNALILPSSHFT